eukprot:g11236.t1
MPGAFCTKTSTCALIYSIKSLAVLQGRPDHSRVPIECSTTLERKRSALKYILPGTISSKLCHRSRGRFVYVKFTASLAFTELFTYREIDYS